MKTKRNSAMASEEQNDSQRPDFTQSTTEPAKSALWGALGMAAVLAGRSLYLSWAEEQEENHRQESPLNAAQTENRWNEYQNRNRAPEKTDENLKGDAMGEEINSFCCPITTEVMRDPVNTPYGHAYERAAIVRWVQENNTDPVTSKPLTVEQLTTAYSLRRAIEEYIERKSSLNRGRNASAK
eukprot:CFRG1726T1